MTNHQELANFASDDKIEDPKSMRSSQMKIKELEKIN